MIIIAHRANLYGPAQDKTQENLPRNIYIAVKKGLHVEVDIQANDKGEIYFGHDECQESVADVFTKDDYQQKIFWHAKDSAALMWALNKNLHCFFHNKDNMSLTSRDMIWTAHHHIQGDRVIVATNEDFITAKQLLKLDKIYGICTDHTYQLEDSKNL